MTPQEVTALAEARKVILQPYEIWPRRGDCEFCGKKATIAADGPRGERRICADQCCQRLAIAALGEPAPALQPAPAGRPK